MHDSFDIVTIQCRLKAAQKKIADLESGREYLKMQELLRKNTEYYASEISRLRLELAGAHRETVDVREKWLEVIDDIEKEHSIKIRALNKIIKGMERRALNAERQRDSALDRLKKLGELYSKLSLALEEEQDKNAKLRAQLGRDYENSSIPSSKSLKNKKITNSREKSGKLPGAQPGHAHHGRKKQEPTEIIRLQPPAEARDNQDFRNTGREIVKQMVGISLMVNVSEYHADIYYNPKTNEYIHAKFPDGVTDDVNYDGSIKAFLYLLNNDCATSIDKSRKFLYDLSGGRLDISKGMINKLGRAFSEKSAQEIKQVFSEMQLAPVMHTDCTNAKVNGKNAYVFVCAVPDGPALYFARKNKGHEGVKGTVAEDYQGILVHDHEITFYRYGSGHQECLAHVLRYLKDSMDNEPGLAWNKKMRALLQEMIHYRNTIPDGGEADAETAADYGKRYSEILALAEKEYTDSPPGKYYRDGYNLYKRMQEFKSNHLLFLSDMRVPTTNNLSERLLRKYKRKQVQATSFRSLDSIGYLCDGMSMLFLMRLKNDANIFEKVSGIFEA